MDVREYFRRVQSAHQELELLKREREHLMSMATGVSGMSETAIRATGNRSKVESAALALLDLGARFGDRAEEAAKILVEASELISKLERPRQREILSMRYIQGMSWGEITKAMDYTDPKSVYRVHGWALLAAQKLLDGM